MAEVTFSNRHFTVQPEETVLECLTRHGALLPSKCKTGGCRTCMVRATHGKPSAASQKGLKDTFVAQGKFLPCLCYPTEDLTLAPLEMADHHLTLTVVERKELSPRVLRLRLSASEPFTIHPGQAINLVRTTDQQTRSYSVASLPSDRLIELHIRRGPTGNVSHWIWDRLTLGQTIDAFGPVGDSFYLPKALDQPIMVVAADTALAGPYGIIKDALGHGHSGPVELIHGTHSAEDLYLDNGLQRLTERHGNLTVTRLVTGDGPVPDGVIQGTLEQSVKQTVGTLKGWRCYLFGEPEAIRELRRTVLIRGGSIAAIYVVSYG